MDRESKALDREIYEICWYMRGGITREEAWALSFQERKTISKIVEKNVENTKKSGISLM